MIEADSPTHPQSTLDLRPAGASVERGDGLKHRLPVALEFSEHLRRAEKMNERVEALILARAIALAGLPKKRTRKRDVSRTVRLGRDLWVRVTYSAAENQELPFGEDRFVLAGIIHLAIEQGSPVVFFDSAGELLKLFGIHRNDQSYELLRQRFKRIGGLSISLEFAETEEGLDDANVAQRSFVLSNYSLPSRKDIAEAMHGQRQLSLLPGVHSSRYGVVLSDELWRHLCQSSNHLLVPIQLLQMFVDNPTGWDYLIFLVARCGAAKTPSKVPHEALMNLFKDAENEPDRKVIAKLRKIHALIMAATDDRLVARLDEDGYFPRQGPGRPRKRWCLHVGPSQSLFPDKRPRLRSADAG